MFPTSTSCCLTTLPISTTTRTMLPRKHGPHGMPPSASRAGITSSQPSGSLKSEGSESETAGLERRSLLPLERHSGTLAHSRISILGALSQHCASTSSRLLVHYDV